MNFIPAEIIKKKKRGEANTDEEILFMIENYSRGDLPDYQMSAWAMAINFQEMNENERATLTLAMRDSGYVYDFTKLGKPCVDKHSTGGVGDKASLILAPIVAAAGVPVPMIAGRGLGHWWNLGQTGSHSGFSSLHKPRSVYKKCFTKLSGNYGANRRYLPCG